MSTNIFNQKRRRFLKASAYTSALSVCAVASVSALADITGITSENKSGTFATVTLFNQSDSNVVLDATQPVSLEKVNGWVVVKINKALNTVAETVMLNPGQKQVFTIDSEFAPLLDATGDYIVITDQFTALNNMVPVSTYDALVA